MMDNPGLWCTLMCVIMGVMSLCTAVLMLTLIRVIARLSLETADVKDGKECARDIRDNRIAHCLRYFMGSKRCPFTREDRVIAFGDYNKFTACHICPNPIRDVCQRVQQVQQEATDG